MSTCYPAYTEQNITEINKKKHLFIIIALLLLLKVSFREASTFRYDGDADFYPGFFCFTFKGTGSGFCSRTFTLQYFRLRTSTNQEHRPSSGSSSSGFMSMLLFLCLFLLSAPALGSHHPAVIPGSQLVPSHSLSSFPHVLPCNLLLCVSASSPP